MTQKLYVLLVIITCKGDTHMHTCMITITHVCINPLPPPKGKITCCSNRLWIVLPPYSDISPFDKLAYKRSCDYQCSHKLQHPCNKGTQWSGSYGNNSGTSKKPEHKVKVIQSQEIGALLHITALFSQCYHRHRLCSTQSWKASRASRYDSEQEPVN